MEAPSSPAPRLVVVLFLLASLLLHACADDPYRFYTWNVTFGDIYPLGVKQEVRPARTASVLLPWFALHFGNGRVDVNVT